jgi:hypothetical protein
VVNFGNLPIAKPPGAASAYAMLAGRTQSDTPDAADEVFVSAVTTDKVYIAYGSIEPTVKVAACLTIRTDYNKRAEQGDDDFRFKKSTRRPTTSSATFVSAARVLMCTASRSVRRSNRHSLKQHGRRRSCWQQPWKNNARDVPWDGRAWSKRGLSRKAKSRGGRLASA